MPVHQLAHNFTVTAADIDYLTNLLLERETPMTSEELTLELIQYRLDEEAAAIQEKYKDTSVYNPAESYEVGQRLVFSQMDFATAHVTDTRPGNNERYGDFTVMEVEFDQPEFNPGDQLREFACNLTTSHALIDAAQGNDSPLTDAGTVSPEEILESARGTLVGAVESRLQENNELINVARKWFPQSLMMEIEISHLHLAEAVLDMNNGGPLTTADIIREIGGLGNAPEALQVFSLNNALNKDNRFDEVGPAGEVLWFLSRMEPPIVSKPPALLRYDPIPYDRAMLTPDMVQLETEIDDEFSPLEYDRNIEQATVIITYPHRRMNTLPLNAKTRQIFPTAHTPVIHVTLVDGQDGEAYTGWVVHQHRFVYGLEEFYQKHLIPVGAYVTIRQGQEPGQFVINFEAYRARTEWIRLIIPGDGQLEFENDSRAIGAEYDDLVILGVDDIDGLDAMHEAAEKEKRSLVSILKMLIPALAKLTPQGTVHAKTIYSAVNVIRRYPPGPIFATLMANPDFENVGGHYWKLS